MPKTRPSHLRQTLSLAALLGFTWCLIPANSAIAVEPASQPAAPPSAPHPALEELNRECISLYDQLQGGVLRVQMPVPRWVANSTLRDGGRWDNYKLNPDVKRALVQSPGRNGMNQQGQNSAVGGNSSNNEQSNSPGPQQPSPGPSPVGAWNSRGQNSGHNIGVSSNSSAPPNPPAQVQQMAKGPQVDVAPPGTAPSGPSSQPSKGYTFVVPAPPSAFNNDLAPPQLLVGNRAGGNGGRGNELFLPNCVGLLLDHRGHVLVPMYLEREAVGDQPIKLAVGDSEAVDASFVGSDEQTQLTVLRLGAGGKAAAAKAAPVDHVAVPREKSRPVETTQTVVENREIPPDARPGTEPVRLSSKKLAEGSIVLMLSSLDGAGRLSVWNGGAKENGVVVTIDGQVAGIARGGQFLSGAACRLIADQIVAHGTVRRATLGVIVTQVDAADLGRPQIGDLPADRSVLRVDQVMKGSVAELGGVQTGDLIVSVADETVSDIPGLAALVAARQGPTKVTVLRGGKSLNLEVLLIQR